MQSTHAHLPLNARSAAAVTPPVAYRPDASSGLSPFRALRALGPQLDAVLDVTVSYTSHPAVATQPDPRPNESSCLLFGLWPRYVHFHVERVPAAQLRAGKAAAGEITDADAAAWLQRAWVSKERRLANAATSTAASPGDAAVAARPVANAVVLGGWVILVRLAVRALRCDWGARLGYAMWLLTIAGALSLAAVTRAGGLDAAEHWRFPVAAHKKAD